MIQLLHRLHHRLILMSQLNTSTSEIFYIMAKQRDIALTYTHLMDSSASRWFLLTVDAAPDEHTFVHLSLSKGETSSGKIEYTLWHSMGQYSRRVGVGLVEYNPSDKDFNHGRVSDR